MIKRIIYSIRQTWNYRAQLKSVKHNLTTQSANILAVDVYKLQAEGIRELVLDFDGVMAPHGVAKPLPEVLTWLDRACACFGEDHVFILSNNPIAVRKNYFREHYPRLRFIAGVRKKPYPDGLLAISAVSGSKVASIALLDDRLLTGVLAALIADCKVIYITEPYISWRKHLLEELFFWCMRKIERLIFI